jgi:hypothetical protein
VYWKYAVVVFEVKKNIEEKERGIEFVSEWGEI